MVNKRCQRHPFQVIDMGWCPACDDELHELAKRAVENDRRTEAEKIKDAVDFILNCPLGE
jgi:hypothetical protein